MPLVYGVDLGAHTIKISVLEGSFGRFQLTDVRTSDVPQSVQERPDLERRLMVLRHLLEELETERVQFACAYPAEHTALRVVNLPFAERAKIDQTLGFVIGDYVPFDLDDSVLDHRILEVLPGASKVLTAIAPLEQVRERLDALMMAGVDASSLCVDSDLLGPYATAGVQAIIDLGHERILAGLAINGELKTSRAISGGGRDLTLAIAQAAGVDWDTAEARKHAAELAPDSDASLAEASWDEEDRTEPGSKAVVNDTTVLLKALRPQLNALRTTLINFEDTLEVEVDEVILLGGGAGLGGLRAHLTEELGVPVRSATMPEGLEGETEPLRLGLAYALGQRAAKMDNLKALNLRRGELSFQGDLANIGFAVRTGFLAAVAILVLGAGWYGYRYTQLQQELQEVESVITQEIKSAFPEMSDSVAADLAVASALVVEETAAATERVDKLSSLQSGVPPTLDLYRKLVQGMPQHSDARVDVSKLTITSNSIFFDAETDGFEEATRIESALQNVEGFENAKKGEETRDRQGNINFSVTIPYGERDEEAG